MSSLLALYTWRNEADSAVPDVDAAPVTEEMLQSTESDQTVFLEYCHEIRSKNPQQANPYFLVLSYLMDAARVQRYQDKILELFAAYWHKDKNQAWQFYATYIENDADATLLTRLQTTIVELLLPEIRAGLSEESDLLGIAPAWQEVDDLSLIGVLLILLERGIAPEKIIETGVLHRLFKYHAGRADELQTFYRILRAFPEATLLTDKVSNTVAHIPGDKQTAAFPRHALDATFVPEGSLNIPTLQSPSFHFTISTLNFTKLYELFGVIFLQQVLLAITKNNHQSYNELFKNWIHQATHIQVSELILLLRSSVQETLLRKVAELISNAMCNHFVSKHDGVILYLARFRPNLLAQMSDEKIHAFIADIQKMEEPFESIKQLTAMLKGLDDSKVRLQGSVFQKIVELFLQNTQLADDAIFALLKPHTLLENNHKWLQELAASITALLETSIQENSPFLVTIDNQQAKAAYCSIRNTWSDALSQVELLQKLDHHIHISLPPNEYALICSLVAKLLQNGHDMANLLMPFLSQIYPCPGKATTDTATPTPTPTQEISTFEKTLIELLICTDNAPLRTAVIACIAGEPCNRANWMDDSRYQDLIKHAVKRIDPGLVKYLLTVKPVWVTAELVNEILRYAVQAENAALVGYLLGLDGDTKPTQDAINNGFTLAAHKEHIPIMKLFLASTNVNKPSHNCIDDVWYRSINYQLWNSLQYMLDVEAGNNLPLHLVNDVLITAAMNGKINILEHIFALQIPKKPSKKKVSAALERAARAGSLPVVEYMFKQKVYQLTNQDIRNALSFTAAREIFQFLIRQTNNLSQEDVDFALHQAAEYKVWDAITNILLLDGKIKPTREAVAAVLGQVAAAGNLRSFQAIVTQPGYSPSREAMDKALRIAADAKAWNIVHYILTLTGDIRPTSAGINLALLDATSNSEWGIVQSILAIKGDNAPNQFHVCITFRKATISSRQDILETILRLEPEQLPTKEDINETCGFATHSGETTILRYFLQLDITLRPDRAGMNQALESAARGRSSLTVVRYLLEELERDLVPDDVSVLAALKATTEYPRNIKILDYLLAYAAKHRFSSTAVAEALSTGASHDNIAALERLLALDGDKTSTLGKALCCAAANRKITALNFLLTLDGKDKLEKTAIGEALVIVAASKDDYGNGFSTEKFNTLKTLLTVAEDLQPTQEAVDSALIALMMRLADDVLSGSTHFLLLQAKNPPSSKAIGDAFVIAASTASNCHRISGEYFVAQSFLKQTTLTSDQCGEALISAARANNCSCVSAILNHKGKNAPSDAKIVEALKEVIANKNWELVALASKKLSKANFEWLLQQVGDARLSRQADEKYLPCPKANGNVTRFFGRPQENINLKQFGNTHLYPYTLGMNE